MASIYVEKNRYCPLIVDLKLKKEFNMIILSFLCYPPSHIICCQTTADKRAVCG